jgi:hypothetical protein
MYQRGIASFVIRRAGEVRRHLAAVLLAAFLVVVFFWLVGLPMISMAISSPPADHGRPATALLALGHSVPDALPVARVREVSLT